VLPSDWTLFQPLQIHPDFLEWFRAAYQKATATLPTGMRQYRDEHRQRRWLEALGMPGWSFWA